MKLLLIIILLCVGCIPPSSNPIETTANFTWTAVGDDGLVGQADEYDMRHSFDSLTLIQWDNAKQLMGLPKPNVAGETEKYSTKVISNVTYYFALKTVDKAGNWSQISNIKKFNSQTSRLVKFN